MPHLPPRSQSRPPLPWQPARGSVRAEPNLPRVEFFVGCVTELLQPATNRATVRILQRSGLTVTCPREQVCCAAIHHHAGRAATARQLAKTNVAAFSHADGPIIVNVAGCGAMLKQYGHLLADDPKWAAPAAAFAQRMRDVSEFLSSAQYSPDSKAAD